MTYKPRDKTAAILEAAWNHVQGVPYKVSMRWLFYRLLQDGFYVKKRPGRKGGDYVNKFKDLFGDVRKDFYENWRPDTLADETRTPIVRTGGYADGAAWARAVKQRVACNLDHFFGQDGYVIIMYEARAMTAQFEHYTRRVNLYPCGGDPSHPYKWDIAKHIEGAADRYGLPVVVLYFGDYDQKGMSIAKAALADIRAWSDAPFEWVRCGLNEGDGERLGIPENPEKPGQYQWEALDDATAGWLIHDSVAHYVDAQVIRDIERREREAEAGLREYLQDFAL